VELLAKGTGKSKEEIAKDIQRPKYFRGQEAVDYGLCEHGHREPGSADGEEGEWLAVGSVSCGPSTVCAVLYSDDTVAAVLLQA